jgi:hypothetical protein
MWDVQAIHRALVDGLRRHEAELASEQAVRGLDALDELSVHPLLAQGLAHEGWGVLRETPYPVTAGLGTQGNRPRHRERDRCDIVLTPSRQMMLIDPIAQLRERDKWQGSLFEAQSSAVVPAPQACAPADAFWLEVKVVGQFAFVHGVPIANGAYGSQLTAAFAGDLSKLAADAEVRFGAAVLVLFTQDEATAKHDLTVALHRVLDKGFSLRNPIIESFAITDRIGNACCTVAMAQP